MLINQFKVLWWPQSYHNKAKLTTVLLAVLSLNIANAAKNAKEVTVFEKNVNSENEVLSITQKPVKGTVVDEKGLPIPAANVKIKGTTIGTQTDFDGHFTLNAPDGATTLVVSFIGMAEVEVAISNSPLRIVMKEAGAKLDEVIVVGYGTQKKSKVTGAISTIKLDKIAETRPIIDIGSAIQGLSSGVTVRQSSGNPNDNSTIRIRGNGTLNSSAPLTLVDGFVASINQVNPHDIATITILKDAAAASIYGARAAHGVVLITTKKGTGKKMSVTYGNMTSFIKPIELRNMVNDYPTYMRMINEGFTNTGATKQFTDAEIDRWEQAKLNPNELNSIGVPNYIASPNTDWVDAFYNNNIVTDNNLSINGSTENTRYLVSGQLLHNSGLVDETGLKKYNFRVNFEADVSKWLTIGTRIFSETRKIGMGDFNNADTYLGATTPGMYPVLNGQYGAAELTQDRGNNIISGLHTTLGTKTNTNLNTVFYTKAKIIPGLSLDLNYNYIKQFRQSNTHTNPDKIKQVRFSDGTVSIQSGQQAGSQNLYTSFSNYSYNKQIFESILRFDKKFADKHEFNAIAGFNQTKYYSSNTGATMKGLVDPAAWAPSSATEKYDIFGTDTDWSTQSLFGRLTYTFDKRYIVEGSFRRDGSSKFAEGSRFGFFPSVSAGWVISEESFMKNQNVFQLLKLRASWGLLGSDNTSDSDDSGNYDYMSKYGAVDYVLGGVQTSGLRVSKIANNNLQWETIRSRDIGLDAEFLDRRLSIEMDYYDKYTTGILTTPPISLTLGTAGAPTINGAEVTNKGFEFTAGWNDKIGQVNYRISGNFSYNIDKVTKYRGTLQEGWTKDANGVDVYQSNLGQVSSGTSTRVLEGHRINEYYMLNIYKGDGSHTGAAGGPKDGMIRTPEDMAWVNQMVADGYTFFPTQGVAKNKLWYGDYIYADTNGDKKFGNSFDNTFTGYTDRPKFLFGSQMGLSYKNFTFDMIWAGQAGVKFYFLSGSENSPNVSLSSAMGQRVVDDHYYYNDANPSDPKNNINGTYPRLTNTGGQSTATSTHWLYDASYVRLKNLTIGYTIPLADKTILKDVKLYVSGENLFTITSYPGLDPEMGSSTSYPIYKQVALGANINF
jgi:TonB-linked SusC/RagA family outer membrane protein